MRERPGHKGRFVEVPDDLDARFRAYCDSRGLKYSQEVRHAMERHLAYPPPAVAPLPNESTSERPPKPKRKG